MIETYKARSKAERALIEFLGSLKYYSERWLRARSYAMMCGFIKDSDYSVGATELETDTFTDNYLNEFYFYAYNLA